MLTNEKPVLPGGRHHEHVEAIDVDVGGFAVRVGPWNLNGELLYLAVHTSANKKDKC